MADRRRRALDAPLAGEIDAVRRTLEELAETLCVDPVVFDRHAAAVQRFDQLAQVLGEVAGILRSKDPVHVAVGAIRLEAMRERLTGARSSAAGVNGAAAGAGPGDMFEDAFF